MKKVLKSNWLLILVILGIVLVRGYYLYMSYQNGSYTIEISHHMGDAGHYLQIAKNISDFHVYSDNQSEIATEMATWRPPVWPMVLSLFYKFSDNLVVLIFLKLILETSLILLVVLKLGRYFSLKSIYVIPFLFLFVEPQYLKYSLTFLSESFTAVLILMLLGVFISLNRNKRYHIAIPALASIIVLTHPVSVFFVLTIFGIYLLYNLKSNFKIAFLHGLLFAVIILIWPGRNYLTFNKGVYLTASQGAVFSKGWNEKVSSKFTNVDGDLADEELNLKYVDSTLLKNSDNSVLDLGKLYKEGTLNYLSQIPFQEKASILLTKITSNFNPFPEKPKPGFLESLSIVFRSLYLLALIQLFIRLFRRQKFSLDSNEDKAFLIIASVFTGQIIMASYIYTGLRFNSIYSLALLGSFLIINLKTITSLIAFISGKYQRISKIYL